MCIKLVSNIIFENLSHSDWKFNEFYIECGSYTNLFRNNFQEIKIRIQPSNKMHQKLVHSDVNENHTM